MFKRLLFLLIIFPLLAVAFIDNSEEEVRLLWNREGMLQAEENVFIASFYETYKDIPLEKLEVKDLFKFLQDTFNNERKTLINNAEKEISWISTVKHKDYVIGYISFEFDKISKEVYIRQLAVIPDQMRRGIGEHLISSIKNKYPTARKIVVIFRKVNLNAFKFYKKLGFKKSPYMHHGYNAQLYSGLEFVLSSAQ